MTQWPEHARRRLPAEPCALTLGPAGDADLSLLVGTSAAASRLRADCAALGPRQATVLIIGATGSGKSVVAAELRRHAPPGPFVRVAAAELTPPLIQSTLAGHVRGGFTGAVATRVGLLELAHGGILFGDDFGDLDPAVQPYLLDVLEGKPVRPVGGEREVVPQVRWLIGLQRTPEALVAEGRLRRDLAARLGYVRIEIPPLGERPEDVPSLARHFAARVAAREGVPAPDVAPEVLRHLTQVPWPDNVRQLENVLLAATLAVVADGGATLRLHHLPASVRRLTHARCRLELPHITEALEASDGIVVRAALQLGVHPRTLWRRMKRLGMERTLHG